MSWLHWFDNTPLVGFYALGLVAIIASLRVIMLANPVHAILSMIVTLLALAGIFFILGAPFAGALQVIVYAGAILVLFVFVIMMLNLGIRNDSRESKWLASDVWAVPTGLTFIIAIVLFAMLSMDSDVITAQGAQAAMIGGQTVTAKHVGIALFSEYLLLVEVAAMLLLAALVAAYHLGKKALNDENYNQRSEDGASVYGDEISNDALSKDSIHLSKDTVNTDPNATSYHYESIDGQRFKTAYEQQATRANLQQKEDS